MGSLPPWRATSKSPLRLPASGIELGYIVLTVAFAAILGVAIASFTITETVSPARAGANAAMSTINAAATGTGTNTGRAGLSPALIHNLGVRLALASAAGRF